MFADQKNERSSVISFSGKSIEVHPQKSAFHSYMVQYDYRDIMLNYLVVWHYSF